MADDDLRRLERELRRTGSAEAARAYEGARRRSRPVEPVADAALALAETRARAFPPVPRAFLLSELAWARACRGEQAEAEADISAVLATEGIPGAETYDAHHFGARAHARLGGAATLVWGDGRRHLHRSLDLLAADVPRAGLVRGTFYDTLGRLEATGHSVPADVSARARDLFAALAPRDQAALAAGSARSLRWLLPLESLRGLAATWLDAAHLAERSASLIAASLFDFVAQAATALTAFHDGALPPELARACWDAVADERARATLDLTSHEDDSQHAQSLAAVETVWSQLLGALGDEAPSRVDALRSALQREEKPIEAVAAGLALTSSLLARGDLARARTTLWRTWEDTRRLGPSTPLATCTRRVCALADGADLAPDALAELVSQLEDAERRLVAGEDLPSIRAAQIPLVVRQGHRASIDAALEVSRGALLADPPPASTEHAALLTSVARALTRTGWTDSTARVDLCAATASDYLAAVGAQTWPRVTAAHAAAGALTALLECDRLDEALSALAAYDRSLKGATVDLLAQDLARWPRPLRLALVRGLFASLGDDVLSASANGSGPWLTLFAHGLAELSQPLT